MAANSGSDSNGAIVGINVTPLVDIMLVLLIIFMVTAKLVVAPTTAIPLDLPKASKGDVVQVIFSVSLVLDGRTMVNGQQVANDDAILPMARGFHAEHPDGKAVIRADAHVFHQRVIKVMSLLSDANISQIAFADIVEPKDAPPAP
jgi:biopolymer transport protein ExbD